MVDWMEARIETARLLGSDPSLVLHGGGNTSVKGPAVTPLGTVEALYMKASGHDLATIGAEGHPALDLERLRQALILEQMSDEAMLDHVRACILSHAAPMTSLETLVHAAIPARYVDHSHAGAILALTNREGGEDLAREALGPGTIVLPYVLPGFDLARAVAAAWYPEATAIVLAHHGLITWGDTARESYQRHLDCVARAEAFLDGRGEDALAGGGTEEEVARRRLVSLAPWLRGLLSEPGDADRASRPSILRSRTDAEVLALVGVPELGEGAVITTDHLIRTGPRFASVPEPAWDDDERLPVQLALAFDRWREEYAAYLAAHDMPEGLAPIHHHPRVLILPGLGIIAAGQTVEDADIALDIAVHTLAVRARIRLSGGVPRDLTHEHLFAMEYRPIQHAKLRPSSKPLQGRVALITGTAGAIGAGIAEVLLQQGAAVAATDLPGARLDGLESDLKARYGARVAAIPLDVTDEASVTAGFDAAVAAFGGVDLVVPNAGIALVRRLEDMGLDEFRRLEKVNIEGTLLTLRQAARHFRFMGIGGDVVLVSTKNVFCPGAGFGAYSSTKAGAHQLARIAVLELAGLDVRVNMVSPDAVFSHGEHRSALWEMVGPDRMKARGLDQEGLEAYYQNRNLLKAKVLARHVGNAVLYFATRQSPTTGATIPVDGGLPDSTPR